MNHVIVLDRSIISILHLVDKDLIFTQE